jgi:hypothetical protein
MELLADPSLLCFPELQNHCLNESDMQPKALKPGAVLTTDEAW